MFINVVFTKLIIFPKYNTIRLRASFDDHHQSSCSTKSMSQKTSKSALDWRLAQPPAVLYLEPWQLELFIQSRSSSSCLTVCAGEVELIRSPGVSLSPVALLCSSLSLHPRGKCLQPPTLGHTIRSSANNGFTLSGLVQN